MPPVLDYLCQRFPAIPRGEWERRIAEGKVLGEDRLPLRADAPCVPGSRLLYFREVADEPVIPFTETILCQDGRLLVADKPPFLPVTPAGRFVRECLLARLRQRTGNPHLAPLHRIDRETAGLVAFSADPATRGAYAALFREGRVEKVYQAFSAVVPPAGQVRWEVADRLERGEPFFRMRIVPGPVNARTSVELVEVRGGRARFDLRPHTGRKHQLRVHMASLGFPIENDRWYPVLLPQEPDDHSAPLSLLARSIRFSDPLTGVPREFHSLRA